MTDQTITLPPEAAESFRAMFTAPEYDPAAGLSKARALLPEMLHHDQYFIPLALIFANSPTLTAAWPQYFKNGQINIDGINRQLLGKLSRGEQTLVKLALHLFNDGNKLPADGLLSLRLLDSYNFNLVNHALRFFVRGER